MPSVEQLPYDMLVTSPLGHSVRVNQVYKNHLMTHDREFSVDILSLPFHEFDLILGMDWLSKHRVIGVNQAYITVQFLCVFIAQLARFTFIFTDIALIPYTIMFHRTW